MGIRVSIGNPLIKDSFNQSIEQRTIFHPLEIPIERSNEIVVVVRPSKKPFKGLVLRNNLVKATAARMQIGSPVSGMLFLYQLVHRSEIAGEKVVAMHNLVGVVVKHPPPIRTIVFWILLLP